MKTTQCLLLLSSAIILTAANVAAAEDAYYSIPVAALKAGGDSAPPDARTDRRRSGMVPLHWHPVLNGPGEIYLDEPRFSPWMDRFSPDATVCIRTPAAREVTGHVFVSRREGGGMEKREFKVASVEARPDAKDAFWRAKQNHYRLLQSRNIPGAAWFRHQALEAGKQRGLTNADPDMDFMTARQFGRPSELEDSYDLFTGGRALSENLQLDRVMTITRTNEETVDLASLTGITVKEMNWKELIQDAKPALDPLAAAIPADQHAVFFPSFQAMTEMIDEAEADGTPVLQLLEPRSEDADARGRYQKQLCLGLSDISRMLGPQVVASAAFTGSDPFLRVGTDLAVVFEARNVDALKTFLFARQKLAQTDNAAVKSVKGEIAGVAYAGVVSPDRSVSSYIASVSNAVFVCNSRSQLETLVRTAKGGTPAIASQDEYVFFRIRYPRTDKSETAFVVLTDATIRRWCGPRWRIGDSRRTRAAAVMTDLQAAHLDKLVSGKATDTALLQEFNVPAAGEWRLTRGGVVSSTYGSLNFMTPIAELSLTKVTRAEAESYQRWRDNYQRNWRQVFDPIAVRFSVASNRLGAELTVMPLITASDYNNLIEFSSGAQIAPGAGDPHADALLHLVFAINTQARSIREAGNFMGTMAPGLKSNPFGWLGQSIAIYVDEDPFWARLQQSTNSETFLEENYFDLPLALRCEVKNPLGLAAFLTTIHAFVDQSAPKMTTWENLDYKDQVYVKIAAPSSGRGAASKLAFYYSVTPDSLLVTLSEPLLKRALDRQAARAAADKDLKAPAPAVWLGTNISVSAERKFFDLTQALMNDTYQTRLQLLAWNNLPVLNEWKRLYPGKDPVKFHEQLWGTKLLCPGGGTYVWNEKWQTMESTVLGHPGEPKTASAKALADILSVQLGVNFETQGLSAKAVLNRKPKN